MKDQRDSWFQVLRVMWLANHGSLRREQAQAVMDQHFAAEELLLRSLHPELMK